MGSTNLACRHCDTPLDLLEMRAIDAAKITPDTLFQCPYCPSCYYPELGLLHSLYGDGQVEKEYFGTPLSLGGNIKKGLNHVDAGEHRPVKMHSLEPGYEYDSIHLLGTHREGIDKQNWLPFEIVGNQNQGRLGDSVLISLLRTESTKIAINATLNEDRSSSSPINFGDTLEVVYAATTRLDGVTNPPWVDLLIEAQNAIRQGNTLAALPVLRSAVDNCLIRQMYIYLIWDGYTQDSARDWIDELEDGYSPNRITIAKQGLQQTRGTRLTDGEYATIWEDFTQVVDERDEIIHSETSSALAHPSRSTAVDFFNTTVSLLVATYDLFGFHNS